MVHTEKSQGRNLETGTAAETMRPHGLLSLFLYKTEDCLLRGGTIHSGLDTYMLSKKMPTALPKGLTDGSVFSDDFLACVSFLNSSQLCILGV